MKADRHVHTPFCPHGSADSFDEYIMHAIELGLKEITFTEHAPLPHGFEDPTPDKDSGMDTSQLLNYFQELRILKERYQNQILIKSGLEVDFIEGYESETKDFLNEIGEFLDDGILSVHFIKHDSEWHCIDFSDRTFGDIAAQLGSVDALYEKYYDTLEKSINADLGLYKPKRIGHITLARKFQHRYPPFENHDSKVYRILDLIKEKGYELDYNGAGSVKPLCGEPYPAAPFAKRALELGIPLIFGSDAHQAKDLGQGFETLIPEYRAAIK